MSFQVIRELFYTRFANWWGQFIDLIPNLFIAILILLFFYFLARFLRTVAHGALKRSSLTDNLNNLVSVTVFIAVLFLGVFLSLEILQLQKSVVSLLAGAGIVGLALAFAFQDLVANFVSGTYLGVNQIFQIGDLIKTADYFGIVKDIELRTTVLQQPSGEVVRIPNKLLLDSPLTNYSLSKKRRIDVEVGVSYNDDLTAAQKTAIAVIKKLSYRKKNSPVEVFYTEFGDSSINFVARFWIDFTNKQTEYLDAKSKAIIALRNALTKEGFTIPFPIRTIDWPEFDIKKKKK